MSVCAVSRKAVITGASTGIGAIYADRLSRQGYDLVLIARSADKLRRLADHITGETGRSVGALPADLTRQDERLRVEKVLRSDASVSLLVNNAGIGATAGLVDSDPDQMEQMIELNAVALMRLAYAAAPAFASRGHGTIINIASIAAIAPEVLNGVYGATKAFVLAFSRSLRHEFADKGLRVQVVMPGATATEFWGIAGTPVDHLPAEIIMSAEVMVDAALAGLKLGEFATIPSLPDQADWEAFEQARARLFPNLSRINPAERYGLAPSKAS